MTDSPGPLFDYKPPASDRHGATYERAFDFERLNRQQAAVFGLMRDGKWRTLREISEELGEPEASVSARLRDLRRSEFGGCEVARRRRGDERRGLFEYSVRWHP